MVLFTCILFTIAVYSIVWIILFVFPSLLHPRKENKIKAKLIAHRGGAAEELENTVTAFKSALANGAEMLETDCYWTKDGHVVVSHDSHLLSLTGKDVHIHDLNFEDLPPIKEILDVDFCKGETCSGNPDDRRMPLLREIFELFPEVPINLTVGSDDDRLLDMVMKMVKDFGREDRTIIGSFEEKVVQKIYAKEPNMMLFFSESGFYRLLATFWLGVLPFVSLKESFLQIPPGSVLRDTGMENWLFTAFPRLYEALVLNRFLLFHLHRRGIKVFLWVLNREEQWDHGFNLGADAVMTDYPTRLAEYARRKHL